MNYQDLKEQYAAVAEELRRQRALAVEVYNGLHAELVQLGVPEEDIRWSPDLWKTEQEIGGEENRNRVGHKAVQEKGSSKWILNAGLLIQANYVRFFVRVPLSVQLNPTVLLSCGSRHLTAENPKEVNPSFLKEGAAAILESIHSAARGFHEGLSPSGFMVDTIET